MLLTHKDVLWVVTAVLVAILLSWAWPEYCSLRHECAEVKNHNVELSYEREQLQRSQDLHEQQLRHSREDHEQQILHSQERHRQQLQQWLELHEQTKECHRQELGRSQELHEQELRRSETFYEQRLRQSRGLYEQVYSQLRQYQQRHYEQVSYPNSRPAWRQAMISSDDTNIYPGSYGRDISPMRRDTIHFGRAHRFLLGDEPFGDDCREAAL